MYMVDKPSHTKEPNEKEIKLKLTLQIRRQKGGHEN